MRGIAWAFAICFAAISALTWRFFFVAPLVFSIVITVCLAAGALKVTTSYRAARSREN